MRMQINLPQQFQHLAQSSKECIFNNATYKRHYKQFRMNGNFKLHQQTITSTQYVATSKGEGSTQTLDTLQIFSFDL